MRKIKKHPLKFFIVSGIIIVLSISCNAKKQKEDTGVFTTYYRTCGIHHITGDIHMGENVCVIRNTNLGSYKISYLDIEGNEQYILFKEKGSQSQYMGQYCKIYFVVGYSEAAKYVIDGRNDDWLLYNRNSCSCGSSQNPLTPCMIFVREQTDPKFTYMPDKFWITGRICEE